MPGPPPDEADAYRLLEQLRWGAAPYCVHCGSDAVGYLRPRDGRGRRTRTGAVSLRRVWRCRACRRQFSVLTGTVLHGTRIPLVAWVWAVGELARDGAAPPVDRLCAAHGLSRDAARHVHRLLAGCAGLDEVRAALTGPA